MRYRDFRSLDSLGVNPIQETGISQYRNSAAATCSGTPALRDHLRSAVAVAHVLTSASVNDCDRSHVLCYPRVWSSFPSRPVVVACLVCFAFVSVGGAAVSL